MNTAIVVALIIAAVILVVYAMQIAAAFILLNKARKWDD